MNRRQILKAIAGLGAAALMQSRAAEAQHRVWLPLVCAGSRWLPQNLLWSPGTIFEDFENVGDWTFAAGVAEQDVTHVASGAGSIQMNGSPGATVQMVKDINATIPSWALGRLYIYVLDVSKITSVRIYLMNSSSDYYTMAFAVGGNAGYGQGLRTGWNLMQFAKTDFTAYGSPSWTRPMTAIQVNLVSAAGHVGVVSVDSLIFGVVGQPAIVFSFDDGRASHYTAAYQYMKQYRMVATSYVTSNRINVPGWMTSTQLTELHSQGWDIGNHTRDHTDLVEGGLTDEEITAEYADCKAVLEELGLTRASMHGSMPGSNWSDACTVDAQAAGMLSIRDDTYVNRYFGLPHYSWFLWPRCGNMLNNSTTLAAAKARVDNTITRQQPLVLLTDGLAAAAGSSEWAIGDFQDLVDYIASLHLPTLTITELYRLTSGPIAVSHA